MKKTLCVAAVAVASLAGLAGCASVTTDVQVSGTPLVLQGERTYAIVQTPSQETGAAREQYVALIHNELGNYGLVDRAAERASYMLSLAYDTRPAAVGVTAGDCANPSCNGATAPGFSLFGREYQHSMTLRLFDASTGKEVYKVTATSRDRNADALHPIPFLVKSAFAQFPFSEYGSWRVKLRSGGAADRPEVVTVKPLDK
ncbi:DUF4136 domain-containing protein [Burkholderia sp. Ac-20365]|uniref:DUF4136 domain-containing protein n=1 Tax=Burkholderia sp. Ac-20365 TaxID=2703897 RepID=UPI0032176762